MVVVAAPVAAVAVAQLVVAAAAVSCSGSCSSGGGASKPGEPRTCIAVQLETSQRLRSLLNEVAPSNMPCRRGAEAAVEGWGWGWRRLVAMAAEAAKAAVVAMV